MKTTLVVVMLFAFTSPMLEQERPAPFYVNGNRFLQVCDETNPMWVAANESQSFKIDTVTTCDMWVLGVRQGMEIMQQVRPKARMTPAGAEAAQKAADSQVQMMRKYGARYTAIPNKNICIPDDVTNDQLRLVVVKWMKANADGLTGQAAALTVAALAQTWPCSE